MSDIKIAFFDTKPYDQNSFEPLNSDFGFKIKFFEEHLNPDTVLLTKGYDAVCLFVNDVVTKEVVNQLLENGVRLIAMRCAGYNNIDLETCYNRLHVVRVPAYSPNAVAEHAVALMLTLNRKTHKAFYRTQDNNFTINGLMGFDMFGKTAGVIGTGQIGRILIQILKGFGMKVLAFDAFPNAEAAKTLGFEYVDLKTLYRNSDIISLHCPLTKDTEYLINSGSIAEMKPGVMIINTSRGKLIDTRALIDGLKQRKIGFAGLDVYEEESEYFFEDYSSQVLADDVLARLLSFPNVLITSHQAFFTREAVHNIAVTTLDNVRSFFTDDKLKNEICYQCGQNTVNCTRVKEGRCF
jgi:D-lactate dehydrogenase